ncbi:DinB family protein [Dactylosporangium sp. NPDC051485]|uniref:DinB family protein n=1 Tax=Dactylosporangium sp. NPDC051485 TaxID=3154846 RepID=UPI0034198742
MTTVQRDWPGLVRRLIDRTELQLLDVLDGLPPTWLDEPVEPGTNTIGWLLWHLTRSHDRNVSELHGRPQLWVDAGWHATWGMAADPDETGYRHGPAQLAAFRSPGIDAVAGYHDAVVTMIRGYLGQSPADDLDRPAFSPTLGDTVTVEERLVGVVMEGLQHVGQAALLKGILQRRSA